MADRIHQQKGCVCFIEESTTLMMTTLPVSELSEVLKAEVPLDKETGLRHIRYPVRLPIVRGTSGGSGSRY